MRLTRLRREGQGRRGEVQEEVQIVERDRKRERERERKRQTERIRVGQLQGYDVSATRRDSSLTWLPCTGDTRAPTLNTRSEHPQSLAS
eukprot:356048-Rhodomonas_salina.1